MEVPQLDDIRRPAFQLLADRDKLTNIGVSTQWTIRIKRIDSDYFEEG